ncbi:hypothetical protein BC831DRAFT_453958 [Entophlyctis helioformis]|nr:hypothetical protein BC831DRAFT_453958 [Entophlyctis helioformis]
MSHTKIIYRGSVYGPMRAPTTIRTICAVLKISPRASPTLQSVDRTVPIVVVDINAPVASGLYELLSHPDVAYDQSIDGPMLDLRPAQILDNTPATIHRYSAPTDTPIISGSLLAKTDASAAVRPISGGHASAGGMSSNDGQMHLPNTKQLPLGKTEMDACVGAMVQLISSIPPRYVKYNKVLSAQIDYAMREVDRLQSVLSRLTQKVDEATAKLHHATPTHGGILAPTPPDKTSATAGAPARPRKPMTAAVPLTMHVTFTQFRIVHILYETWKTVWKRYSPAVRSFNISKIQTVHSIEMAEHYLNQLWSWRRILDARTWDRLQQSAIANGTMGPAALSAGTSTGVGAASAWGAGAGQDMSKQAKFRGYAVPPIGVARLLEPPALPSGEHPRAWEYLVQPSPSLVVEDVDGATPTPQSTTRLVVRLNEQTTLREFRQIFIDAILQHRIYRDDELDCLLEELMGLDKIARQHVFNSFRSTKMGTSVMAGDQHDNTDSDLTDDVVVYPTAFIRNAIRSEFRIHWTSLDEEQAASTSAMANAARPTLSKASSVGDALSPASISTFASAAAAEAVHGNKAPTSRPTTGAPHTIQPGQLPATNSTLSHAAAATQSRIRQVVRLQHKDLVQRFRAVAASGAATANATTLQQADLYVPRSAHPVALSMLPSAEPRPSTTATTTATTATAVRPSASIRV